jgi:hypothetical protein
MNLKIISLRRDENDAKKEMRCVWKGERCKRRKDM